MKEEGAEPVAAPMKGYETKLVCAAKRDARQEAVAWTGASPSLCCLSWVYMNTRVFHGLRKSPQHF